MRISDWSSDVCSSDLHAGVGRLLIAEIADHQRRSGGPHLADLALVQLRAVLVADFHDHVPRGLAAVDDGAKTLRAALGRVAAGQVGFLDQLDDDALARRHDGDRSEDHTSELQSLMRISYAVFCLKKKKKNE